VSAFLYSAITIGEPAVHLNPAEGHPFAVVGLDAASHFEITVHTPAEARALATAFEAAAVLLEEHAAQTGPEVTP
jgi:hypothetical protein